MDTKILEVKGHLEDAILARVEGKLDRALLALIEAVARLADQKFKVEGYGDKYVTFETVKDE